MDDVAAFVSSQMNGLLPFERTIKQTTETMPLALKQQQLLTMKRITSLRELLHF